jgi:hypothetical protein
MLNTLEEFKIFLTWVETIEKAVNKTWLKHKDNFSLGRATAYMRVHRELQGLVKMLEQKGFTYVEHRCANERCAAGQKPNRDRTSPIQTFFIYTT